MTLGRKLTRRAIWMAMNWALVTTEISIPMPRAVKRYRMDIRITSAREPTSGTWNRNRDRIRHRNTPSMAMQK